MGLKREDKIFGGCLIAAWISFNVSLWCILDENSRKPPVAYVYKTWINPDGGYRASIQIANKPETVYSVPERLFGLLHDGDYCVIVEKEGTITGVKRP